MCEIKTPPIVGDTVVANHKNSVLKNFGDDDGQILALKFWPASQVEETYRKAAMGIRGTDELDVLRTFYSEMVHYFRLSTRISFDMEEYDWILALTEGVEV